MCVAKTWVTNEHCIGMLKSRWHSLKELRTQLKTKSENQWMVRWINVYAQLHNFNIDMGDLWTHEDQAIVLDHDEPIGHDMFSVASQRGQAIVGRVVLANVMHALDFNRQFG